jgi:hypothetical protein
MVGKISSGNGKIWESKKWTGKKAIIVILKKVGQ